MSRRVALVTGASRGIGAETARILARAGTRVVVNYRAKTKRAEQVVADIVAADGAAAAVQADLTDVVQLDAMFDRVRAVHGRIDALVLNASGGMERGADPGYALRLNRDAQLAVLDRAAALMPHGSRVVFVTSHLAHFHGSRPGLAAYESVARSKRAGEDALRARMPWLAERGISLVVISGDMIDGTITVTLLDRMRPGLIEARRAQAGTIPTVEEFAAEVAAATTAPVATGHTFYVGCTDHYSVPADPHDVVPGFGSTPHRR
ncbi:SDR family oxidoreductase [Dactylosporangium roseum]|uniref:SDR family oxidoreductase n=1 Tax=Dactylosporangium roseum TaxID=47989 RepID=A0ABY5ZGG1_9ACTN|nr:SDR family oxidoreductase [Dactylosporangium roseum]UWZ39359.1 SDR family oxidoreductase [Dactylosporangium roseum]